MKKNQFLKFLTLVCVMILLVSMTVCAQADAYKAGTYTAAGSGNNGPVTVSVELDAEEIKSVTVTEHKENPGICDKAISDVPAAIVEYQALSVDTISGATNTSKAILAAVEDCIAQAGGDVEALKSKTIEKVVSTEHITKDADVVVLGGGGAGLSAAIVAAQNGSKVILVERNPFLGGNTIRTGGFMMVNDPENLKTMTMTTDELGVIEREIEKETDNEQVKAWQDKVRADIEVYKANGETYRYESPEFNAVQLFFRFSESAIPDRLYEMICRSKDDLDWLVSLGFPVSEKGGFCIGDNWPRWFYSTQDHHGNGYIRVMSEAIEQQNLDVELLMETRANKLLTDENGRVNGVTATAVDGTTYTLNASQGVVVATGGFASNSELVKKYSDGRWPDGFENLPTSNDPAVTGDGILMAEELGAQMYDMGHLQILPVSDPVTGQINTLVGAAQGMYINKEGKRFEDESTDRDTMVRSILHQPDSTFYIICCQANSFLDENNVNESGIPVPELVANGKLYTADTLDELAEQIGVPADVFNETVATFNEAVEKGYDEEFGRSAFAINIPGQTVAIGEGPYYACPRKPARHITKGGILINENAQVLDQNNEVIPGFYAAGEVTGGTSVAGLVNCIDTGRLAGEHVSQENK